MPRVMEIVVTVAAGDCVSSLGEEYGIHPDDIWEHPANKALREHGCTPHTLRPGDEITIPPQRPHEEPCASAQRHRFQRLAVPARLKIRLLRNGVPAKNEGYILTIDGQKQEGVTDADGWLDEPVAPHATEATLLIKRGSRKYALEIGNLDPGSDVLGAKARLRGLGFDPGRLDEGDGRHFRAALGQMQQVTGLKVTGQLNQETAEKLQRMFGV